MRRTYPRERRRPRPAPAPALPPAQAAEPDDYELLEPTDHNARLVLGQLLSRWRLDSSTSRCRITARDLVRLWHQQSGRCALSGVALTLHDPAEYSPRLVAIDLLHWKRGLEWGNVRLVCGPVGRARRAASRGSGPELPSHPNLRVFKPSWEMVRQFPVQGAITMGYWEHLRGHNRFKTYPWTIDLSGPDSPSRAVAETSHRWCFSTPLWRDRGGLSCRRFLEVYLGQDKAVAGTPEGHPWALEAYYGDPDWDLYNRLDCLAVRAYNQCVERECDDA